MAMAGYHIRLYVAGNTGRSHQAESRLRETLSRHVPGDHRLEVIDVLAQPGKAEADHILATPTVVRQHPPPKRRVIGELADHDKVLIGLGLDRSDPARDEDGSGGEGS